MEFFRREIPDKLFTLYPLGDFHLGSKQCDVPFVRKVVAEIKDNPRALWVGMGDMMENAIIGSKSDVYTQVMPPREQMDAIADILEPVKKKGLFLIAGNHEQRTMRVAGIVPEAYIAARLGLPYLGFSAITVFVLTKALRPHSFSAYFHHNYGGGYSSGGKINRAEKLRLIAPTVDAIFSGHFHITSRIPVKWYEPGDVQAIEKIGYDYITGSALTWNGSYAEERGKQPAVREFIKITFVGSNTKKSDSRKQIYEVITP